MKRVFCVRKHRMVEITPGLALCECSIYGPLSSRKGIEEDARTLLERSGGLGAIRDKVEQEEHEQATRKRARGG